LLARFLLLHGYELPPQERDMRLLSIPAALTAAFATITPAKADVIFTDFFGPGDGFNLSLNYTVSGPASSLGSSALSPAAGFTPTGNDNLSEIDVALENVSGTNNAVVSLWTDSSGATGTELGSWNVSGLPIGSGAVIVIDGITGITLTSSDTYFVEVAPGAANTYDGWLLSESGTGLLDLGPSGPLYDPPVDPAGSTETEPAYELIGEPVPVPEPASLTLFGSGLIAFGLARRRKRA
jgi:hypothetical protein